MKILFCSTNPAVIRRWHDVLSPYQTEQATTLKDVRRCLAASAFDLALLHRPLLDQQSFSELYKTFPGTRFLLLSDHPKDSEGIVFLKAGISGYANTYISPDRLKEAVRVIADGGVWLGQQIIQRLILNMAKTVSTQSPSDSGAALAGMTGMEQKVALMVAQGMNNAKIAEELKITERTIKAHLTSIYGKTKTGNRLGLALLVNRGQE
ncbi:response regulator transcription factor [Desulfonatronum parangueonense]